MKNLTTAERIKKLRKGNPQSAAKIAERYYEKSHAQMNGEFVNLRENDHYVARPDGSLEKVAESATA